MKIISPLNVQLLVADNNATLIDIREKYELDICKVCQIKGMHIPMGEVLNKIEDFPKDKEIILMCKTGQRAEALANFLEVEHNYSNIGIMKNGIMGWIEEVETHLEEY